MQGCWSGGRDDSLGPGPVMAGTDGTRKRALCPEEIQPDAQEQIEETQQGDDLGESFGSVIGYLKHGFLPWQSG